MPDLAGKALVQLLREYRRHSNPRFEEQYGRYTVIADLYHDGDRLPSYTSEDTVLAGLSRAEAIQLVELLGTQRGWGR